LYNIKEELDKLNKSSENINHIELQLEVGYSHIRTTLLSFCWTVSVFILCQWCCCLYSR